MSRDPLRSPNHSADPSVVAASMNLLNSDPRIFCIADPAARLAAVIERRPRKWWRIGRWDLAHGRYEEGAWFRGTLYPQRCDLSRDGRWLSYFAFKYESDWPASSTYTAISRLPWLKALAAWREAGTWSRGLHFVDDPEVWEVGDPVVGGAEVRSIVGGMRHTEPAQFATERRRGWRESDLTPPRDPADTWDVWRAVVMEKPSPDRDSRVVLSVAGKFEAFRGNPHSWPPGHAPYSLSRGITHRVLTDVQWADWTCEGRLAIATTAGVLQIRDGDGKVVIHEAIPSKQEPKAAPAPAWAGEW